MENNVKVNYTGYIPINSKIEITASSTDNKDLIITISRKKLLASYDGLPQNELELITEKFNQLTKTGFLTKTQFTELYNSLRTEDPERLEKITEIIYSAFDANKDGMISLDEFLSAYTITNHADLKSKLLFLFQVYDRNNEGYLHINDIKYVIEAMLHLLNADLELSADKLAEECFRDLDLNSDGKVSKEEFLNVLLKKYELRAIMNPFS